MTEPHLPETPTSSPTDKLRPRRECAAGIVFALAVEADAFAGRAIETIEFRADGLVFHEGAVGARRIAWCVSGAGPESAARAARRLVAGHRPRVLVSAGFAGGLDPALVRGRLVRPAVVVASDGGDPIPLDRPDGDAILAPAAPTIVTIPTVAATREQKRSLATATGAGLVDMETHAVASIARDAKLPCVSFRVVSDDAGQELPKEVVRLLTPQPPLRRLGAALGALGRRPRAALDLWSLWEHAVVDGRTLAEGLERFCRTLPESG